MARPTKLTPEIHRKIVDLVRMGNFQETAAAAAGVDPRTMRRWVTDGARGVEPYAKFAHELEAAIAEAEARGVLAIQKAASEDWRAALEILKRRFKDRWGDSMDVRVKEQAVEHLLDAIRDADPATYERVLAILAGGEGEGAAREDERH